MLNRSQLSQNGTGHRQAKHVVAGTGPAYCGPGERVVFLLTGAETGGALFMAEVTIGPGGGPPPHTHQREDETFRLLEGTLTIEVAGKTLHPSAGDLVFLPRGVEHCFKNTGDTDAKVLLVCSPAGLENFFAEAFFPAADAVDIPQMGEAFIGRVMNAAPKCGLEFLVPAGMPR